MQMEPSDEKCGKNVTATAEHLLGSESKWRRTLETSLSGGRPPGLRARPTPRRRRSKREGEGSREGSMLRELRRAAIAPAKLRPRRCHFLGGGRAAEGEGGEEEVEEEEEEEEAEEELQAGEAAPAAAEAAEERWKASDRSWVCMRTCSTVSSSVLGLPDQHSSAAAMPPQGTERNCGKKPYGSNARERSGWW